MTNLHEIAGVYATFIVLDNVNLPKNCTSLGEEAYFTKRRVLDSIIKDIFDKHPAAKVENNSFHCTVYRGNVLFSMYLKNIHGSMDDLQATLDVISKDIEKVRTLFFRIYPELDPDNLEESNKKENNNE